MMSPSFPSKLAASRRSVLTGLAACSICGALPVRAQQPATRLIDLHHHHFPPAFIAASERLGGGAPAQRAWSVEKTLEQMDGSGVSQAVLSLSSAGEIWSDGSSSARLLARECNEHAARLVQEHPGRFGFFAALPMLDVQGSLAEIDYALDTLKADGIGLSTSYAGKWPGDPAFAPIYEALDRRKALVYFHPHAPNCCAGLLAGVSDNLIEFPQDTARAVLSLLFSGTLARLTNVQWLFSHAGGPIPALAGRITSLARGERVQQVAPNGIDHELKRLHYETANATAAPAMAALLAYVPISQILFGTDYPFVSVAENREGLAKTSLAPDARAAIQYGNALRLIPRLGS